MWLKNQIKRFNIFNFPLTGIILFIFVFANFFGGLNIINAQPVTNEAALAQQFANDLSQELGNCHCNKGADKKLNAEIEKIRKYNEQLELKCKELHLRVEKQEDQIRDNKSLDLAFKKVNAERLLLKQQKQDLINEVNETLKKSRIKESQLYEEQAMVCLKAKFFDQAIIAFENSLKANPANAQAHYDLSLLYQQVYQDKKKSVAHMKEYLKLSPKAKNKKEAQYIVDMLSEDLY